MCSPNNAGEHSLSYLNTSELAWHQGLYLKISAHAFSDAVLIPPWVQFGTSWTLHLIDLFHSTMGGTAMNMSSI
jgi:hypothetical protein